MKADRSVFYGVQGLGWYRWDLVSQTWDVFVWVLPAHPSHLCLPLAASPMVSAFDSSNEYVVLFSIVVKYTYHKICHLNHFWVVFKNIYLFILAAPDLSCGTRDLGCSMRDL